MADQGRKLKISIIGAGNVAWHLAPALAQEADVVQIISRHKSTAEAIAARLPDCTASDDIRGLADDSDLYVLAVKDDAIADVARLTPDFPGMWVHTSGSVSIDVFSGHKAQYGSLYPLQTFSKEIPVDIRRVPFFIEANTPEGLSLLSGLLEKIADRIQTADSERRKALHIAAVFACNFANQMWADADRLLRDKGLDVTFLLPLLEATLEKLRILPPVQAMTGPARRGDLKVIESHLRSLPPDLRPTYALLSQRILEKYHPDMKPSCEL